MQLPSQSYSQGESPQIRRARRRRSRGARLAAPPKEVLPSSPTTPKALAQARAGNKPIFLEAWAPW